MSRADQLFLQNCRDILSKGVWDTDQIGRASCRERVY